MRSGFAVGCAAFLGTLGLGVVPVVANAAPGSPAGIRSGSQLATRTDPFAVHIDTIGSSQYSAVYGGSWQGVTGIDHIGVVDTSGNQTEASNFMSAISASAASSTAAGSAVKYELTNVPHTYAQLSALTNEIASDEPTLESSGVQPVRWGPDPAASVVQVSILNYSPATAALIENRFGANWVEVSSQLITKLPTRA